MTSASRSSYSQRQQGVALVMSMVFLLILTIIGVTGMTTSALQEKMAGNTQDKNMAFQAAESALAVAENFLLVTAPAALPNFSLNTDGYYDATPPASPLRWEIVDWTDCATAVQCLPAATIAGVNLQPRYLIELMAQVSTGQTPGESLTVGRGTPPLPPSQNMYRITARGTGGTDAAVAEVQSVYRGPN